MNDIIETLESMGTFNTLLSLLQAAGLTDTLRRPGPFTLFAPNDAAFDRINVNEISRDRDELSSLLSYHLTEGEHDSSEIARAEHLETESGKALTFGMEGGEQMIDNAKFVAPDIRCGNGIVHVVDNVFLPQFSGWYCGGCC